MSLFSIKATWRGRPMTFWVHAADSNEANDKAASEYGMTDCSVELLGKPSARPSDIQADYDTEKREGWVYRD